jgi:4-hydroxy-tetrahydrodipicolinate reductase
LAGDAYRIVIDGSPRLQCEFRFDEDGDGMAGGYSITAMRVVNAIPDVCRARPGLLSVFDLPMTTGRRLLTAGPRQPAT